MKISAFGLVIAVALAASPAAWGQQARVFVTSTTTDGNFGGIGGGDTICNDLATTASLDGTWVAWLSDSTTDAVQRLSPGSGPFVRAVSGVKVADDIADLTDNTLDFAITEDETGTAVTGTDTRAYTGTARDGIKRPTFHCDDWTRSSGTGGGIGLVVEGQTSFGWTETGIADCSAMHQLYCFELPPPSTVILNDLRFFWLTEFVDGAIQGYGLEIELIGADIAGGTVETPDGTLLNVVDGAADSAVVDLETFDASFGSGTYDFSLTGMSGDTLTFSINATRPEEPTGIVDIDAPLQDETTERQPLLQWSCNGCLGDRLEIFVVEQSVDEDVFEGPLTNTPGPGDARNGSATPDPLNDGLHSFETSLFNFTQVNAQSIDPVFGSDFDVLHIEALEHANQVTFTVMPIGSAYSGGRFSGNFYAVNLVTGAATQVGGENVVGLQSGETFHGLDFAANGTLYGLTSRRLLTIDPNTGESLIVGTHGRSGVVGDLAFDASGTLYGTLDNDVFTIDLDSGLASVLGSPALPLLSGLAFDLDGKLLAIESFSSGDALYELSPFDGSLVGIIGPISANGSQGMDLDVNGQAYLIDDLSEQLFTIDFGTAALNLVGATNAVRLESLAIFTPEPSSGLLGAVALLCLAAMRRSNRE